METVATGITPDYTRILAGCVGSLIGKHALKLKKSSVDTGYSDRVRDGKLRFNRPLNLWSIEKVFIKAAAFDKNANGEPVVVLNGDNRLTISLAGYQEMEDIFPKITSSTVADIYAKAEAGNGDALFICHKELADEVIALNNQERRTLENFLSEGMAWVKIYEEANRAEKEAAMVEAARMGQSITL